MWCLLMWNHIYLFYWSYFDIYFFQVELTSNSLKKYDLALVVDVDGVGQELLSLPISAKLVSSFPREILHCFLLYSQKLKLKLLWIYNNCSFCRNFCLKMPMFCVVMCDLWYSQKCPALNSFWFYNRFSLKKNCKLNKINCKNFMVYGIEFKKKTDHALRELENQGKMHLYIRVS